MADPAAGSPARAVGASLYAGAREGASYLGSREAAEAASAGRSGIARFWRESRPGTRVAVVVVAALVLWGMRR